MGWVKIDDRYRTNLKSLRAGAEGVALDVAGLCFSAENSTDGFIPAEVVPSLYPVRSSRRVAQRLVDVGRWEEVEGGYLIHDYLEYNPTAEQVERKRDATKQRVNAWRNGKRNGVTTSDVADAPSPSPSPSPKDIKSPSDSGNAPPGVGGETASLNGDRLLPRLIGAVRLRGPDAETEARDVLAVARRHLDDKLIDEGIGELLELRKPADRPVYLLTLLNDWASKRGLTIPEMRLHPRKVAS